MFRGRKGTAQHRRGMKANPMNLPDESLVP